MEYRCSVFKDKVKDLTKSIYRDFLYFRAAAAQLFAVFINIIVSGNGERNSHGTSYVT